jgi:hypothetical protein
MRKSLVETIREKLSPSDDGDLVAVVEDAVLRQDLDWLTTDQEPVRHAFTADEMACRPVPIIPGR